MLRYISSFDKMHCCMSVMSVSKPWKNMGFFLLSTEQPKTRCIHNAI